LRKIEEASPHDCDEGALVVEGDVDNDDDIVVGVEASPDDVVGGALDGDDVGDVDVAAQDQAALYVYDDCGVVDAVQVALALLVQDDYD